jgi:fatty acid desaturase
MLCQYKNYFGKPGEGVHSYRIADIAVVDVGFTILVAWLLSYLFEWNFLWCLLGFFILGILMHRLFCVRTKIDTILFT